jgi:GT2 family glycosyltransferase
MSDTGASDDAPTLRVQAVICGAGRAAFTRFFRGISTACTVARTSGCIRAVVLVLGDSSPERLADEAEAWIGDEGHGPFASVDYLRFRVGLGSAGIHNRLFARSAEDLVLVCAGDTYPTPSLVLELVAGLADPTVGVVEARQLPLEHSKRYDPVTGDTSWASGSCLLTRSRVWRGVCGFDNELFVLDGADRDFSWRARLQGWRVVHRASARVFHEERPSYDRTLRSERELEHVARASVLLPWRYSRRDLALERLRSLETSPDDLSRRVGADLRDRIGAGKMPWPIDPDHTVAEFVESPPPTMAAPRPTRHRTAARTTPGQTAENAAPLSAPSTSR